MRDHGHARRTSAAGPNADSEGPCFLVRADRPQKASDVRSCGCETSLPLPGCQVGRPGTTQHATIEQRPPGRRQRNVSKDPPTGAFEETNKGWQMPLSSRIPTQPLYETQADAARIAATAWSWFPQNSCQEVRPRPRGREHGPEESLPRGRFRSGAQRDPVSERSRTGP